VLLTSAPDRVAAILARRGAAGPGMRADARAIRAALLFGAYLRRAKLAEHGATGRGVDWNSETSHALGVPLRTGRDRLSPPRAV